MNKKRKAKKMNNTKKERLGLYENLEENLYHEDPALGSTDIKILSRSVEEFYYRKNCPESFPRTSSLNMGSAIHCLLLYGFKEFFKQFKIRKRPRARSFMGKGQVILSREDWKKLTIWYRRLKSHPASKEIFDNKNIKTEVSYFWEEEGIRFKSRFDILINDNIIVDLKTVENTYKENFDLFMNKSIANNKYHLQAQHYLNGLKNYLTKEKQSKIGQVTGLSNKPLLFVFLFIEKSLPYRVGRKVIGADILDLANREIENAIFKYKEANEKNYWVDPITENITLDDMPAYF
jgi:hypothetical protein